jgi:hypothetical protein
MSLSTLAVSPLIPWPWLAALGGLALAVALLGIVREARGGWLRLLPLAVLVTALANPRLVAEERTPLNDIALVVVDDSPSQSIGDRRAQTAQALETLRQRLNSLPGLDLRVERVGGAPGGDDHGTRLFGAAARALTEIPRRRLAGVVLITDGRVHDVPDDLGRAIGAPVHSLLTGRPGERDRRLVIGGSPGFGLVGRSVVLEMKVEDAGGSGEAAVEVRLDGQPYARLNVPLNRDATIEIPIRHAGQTVVEVAAEPGEGELSLANNRTAVGISGVRDRLKVLLISGEPHAGERTWRNLLKADPAVDLVHFTILRPPEKDDRTPIRELALITFPVRELFEDKLADFDLVIFDRYRRRGVLNQSYYENLARYVRNGGALLAAVGPEFAEPGGLAASALAEVLPAAPTGGVVTQAFRPEVTPLGRRHPVTAGLAGGDGPHWGRWLRQVEVDRVHGSTLLAGAGGRPLVVLDRVGEGRIATVLSDTIWLWARGFEGGGPHAELLRRLAHWLMQEPELEEESLTAEARGGRIEVVRRSLEPPPDSVSVTLPDGSATRLPLADQGDGRAVAGIAADQPGLYRVEDGGRTAVAAAGGLAPIEMAELAATSARLNPVAAATRGSVTGLVEGGVPDLRRVTAGGTTHGRGWIGLEERGEHLVAGLREIPLLPWLLVLFLGLGGLLAAWRHEGR